MGGVANAISGAIGGIVKQIAAPVKSIMDTFFKVVDVAKNLSSTLSQTVPFFKPLDDFLGKVQTTGKEVKGQVDAFLDNPNAALEKMGMPAVGVQVPNNV